MRPSFATAPRWSVASLGGAGGITSEVCALSPSTGTSSLCSRTKVFSRAVLISHSCPGQLCVHWSWDRSSLVHLSRSSARCCQTCWKAGSSRRSLTEGFCSHTACLLARCPQPLLAVLCAINRFPCRTRRRCCPTAPWVPVLWSPVLRGSGAAASCPLTLVGPFCSFSVQ